MLVLQDVQDEHGKLRRVAEAVGKGNLMNQPGVKILLHREQGLRAEEARRDADDANSQRTEFARCRQDHADDASFRRRVGGFAALPFVGRNRSGKQDYPAFAVGHRGQGSHVGCRQAHDIKGRDQVDLDELAEVFQRQRPGWTKDRFGVAASDAMNQNTRCPVCLPSGCQRLFGGHGIGDVAGNGQPADLVSQAMHAVAIDIDQAHLGARVDQKARRLGAHARCCSGHHR